MAAIKEARINRGIPIDPHYDWSESGLIGQWRSEVTGAYGNLDAKRTSINPNFAAVVVRLLREAQVEPGQVVAVGFSGSFPALNICVCAALEILDLNPVIVSSVSASQWGANHPDFLWVDMEGELRSGGLHQRRWRRRIRRQSGRQAGDSAWPGDCHRRSSRQGLDSPALPGARSPRHSPVSGS